MLCLSIAAWMKFVVTQVSTGQQVIDPLEDKLKGIAKYCDGSDADVEQLISLGQIFPKSLQENKRFIDDIKTAYQLLNQHKPHEFLTFLMTMEAA